MPEKFDFSKIEDQKEFENMSQEEKDKIVNEIHEGAIEETLQPKLLDVIKINGSWAQIASINGPFMTIIHLNDKRHERVCLNDYKIINKFEDKVVRDLEGSLSKTEVDNIRWGPEQEKSPFLKKLVTVFGEFLEK